MLVTPDHSVESHLVKKDCKLVPEANFVLAKRYWGSSLVGDALWSIIIFAL